MSILEKLDDKYQRYDEWKREEFRKADGAEVRKEYPCWTYDEELYEAFEEDMKTELCNLTPEDRMEIFASYLAYMENELEDHLVEKYAGASVELMLVAQLLRQVVDTNNSA